MDKIPLLREILSQNPNDSFARYGLAMEYLNRGEVESALTEFDQLLNLNPDYTPGYFMAAQTLAKAERTEEAKERLRTGISTAIRTGNSHAQSEMQAMLDELEY
jgi:tetratricopeptide (TPR) repeat protein